MKMNNEIINYIWYDTIQGIRKYLSIIFNADCLYVSDIWYLNSAGNQSHQNHRRVALAQLISSKTQLPVVATVKGLRFRLQPRPLLLLPPDQSSLRKRTLFDPLWIRRMWKSHGGKRKEFVLYLIERNSVPQLSVVFRPENMKRTLDYQNNVLWLS